MGLEADEVVEATVTEIKEYGVYLKDGDGNAIIVLIPDISTEPIGHPGNVLAMGDSVKVKIMFWIPDKGLHRASIRAVS